MKDLVHKNPFPYTPVDWCWPLEKLKGGRTLVSIGSCFSESVAGKLLSSGFRGAQNPNGILYNPYSIQDAVQRLDIGYEPSDFFEFQGKWHSWAHHGSFSAEDRMEAVERAERARKNFFKCLKKAELCMITFSSAVVYRHLPEKRIVANCQKVPENEFTRELLSHQSCLACMTAVCRKIREWNRDCAIVLTVSPVCHYPGDLLLNSRSKALLLESAYETADKEERVVYFPAYEIMTCELRDYRFYADDLLHPSALAEKIILERFLDCCFEENARFQYEEAERKLRQSCHIPLKEKFSGTSMFDRAERANPLSAECLQHRNVSQAEMPIEQSVQKELETC